MIRESDLVPFTVSHPKGSKVLILSPHPDDETLGCGGTIRLLLQRKIPIKVIFLTSGDKADPSHKLSQIVHYKNPPTPPFLPHSGGFAEAKKGGKGGLHNSSSDRNHITHYALLREKEAMKALKVLGVSDYEFFRFNDRELHVSYTSVIDRLLFAIEAYKPDTIYSPSMVELNPDHRVTAALAMDIQRMKNTNNVPPLRIVFYEIAIPLRPNILVDITSVLRIKKRAINKYKSQLKLIDYLRHVIAINEMRALTVQKARYVEAFWVMEKPLSDTGVSTWLSYQWKISEHS